MRLLINIIAILQFTLLSNAHAARPMMTDDARIIDDKSCQVESWVKNNHSTTEYWALPACNPLGFFELTIGGAKTNSSQAVGFNEEGTSLSNSVMQFKTLFREIQPNNWSVGAAIGRNKHPSSFGTIRTNDIYGYIPFTVSLNDDRQFVHINIGATKRQLDDQFLRTWGMGIEYQLTDNTFAMAESFGETRSTPLYQGGLRHWVIPNRFQMDFTYGNKAGFGGNNKWISIGIRILTPAFLP
ncbi:MAG: hypothetical protein NTX83_01325 [Burkholderiales bacterium]|nr:hypothetical protein [Burkholderiales bacterium]